MVETTGMTGSPRADAARKDVKVFCIGLHKTGTKTLKIALRRLGYRHLKRSAAVGMMWRKGDVSGLADVMEAYDSAEDWPWPLCWREMDAHFGHRARFILTRRRSADIWLDSLKSWSLRTEPTHNLRERIYGYNYPHGAESEHITFYNQHLTDIRAAFAERPGQLLELCFEEGDGFPEICAFLNEPLPRRPLEHANRAANTLPDPAREAENLARAMAQVARLRAERG